MTRAINRLSAASLQNIPPGKHADGGGLWLHKRVDGGAQWVLRVTVYGRRREMGLGSLSNVSLKAARVAAAEWRSIAQDGKDPIKERERRRRDASRSIHLLTDIAHDAFETRKAELKGEGIAGRWFSPIELHILPKLGKLPVADIDQKDIRDTLSPIWHSKADTARKALNRLSICLKHAAALGLDVDLQATEKASALLGKQRHKIKHVPSLPWQDVPSFYASLTDGSVTHLALRLLILTGVRSAPLRHLSEDQVVNEVWTIPSELMKGRRDRTTDFRVPLSTEALKVVEQAKSHARNGYLFPSVRKGVISDATMARFMERRQLVARPHGFRSSLRNWIAENTDASNEIAETCLGHSIGGAVERAYRRTDFLEQRRILMERWSSFVIGQSIQIVEMYRREQ